MKLTKRIGGIESAARLQAARPARDDSSENVPFSVAVVFTTTLGTLSAFTHARQLSEGLGGCIRVIAPVVVPYPLPLGQPPAPPTLGSREFQRTVEAMGVEVRIDVRLCRDRKVAVLQALPPRSMVVIGGSDRWWPTWEKSLARALRRAGHHDIVVGKI